MGRSTFAVPAVYHVHAVFFFGWVAIYLTENWLVASGNVALHRRLGWISAIWVPVMFGLGLAIMVASLPRVGGPFFFYQTEFFFRNLLALLLFAGLVGAAIFKRRETGWHRRFMLVSMAVLSGPSLGRLLPLSLLASNPWRITMVVAMIWPVIGMAADKLRNGSVHPAWYYGVGAVLAVQVTADVMASSVKGARAIALVDYMIGLPHGDGASAVREEKAHRLPRALPPRAGP